MSAGLTEWLMEQIQAGEEALERTRELTQVRREVFESWDWVRRERAAYAAYRTVIQTAWEDYQALEDEFACRPQDQLEAANAYPGPVRALAGIYADRPGYREEWAS